jgi:hypothetical protein
MRAHCRARWKRSGRYVRPWSRESSAGGKKRPGKRVKKFGAKKERTLMENLDRQTGSSAEALGLRPSASGEDSLTNQQLIEKRRVEIAASRARRVEAARARLKELNIPTLAEVREANPVTRMEATPPAKPTPEAGADQAA